MYYIYKYMYIHIYCLYTIKFQPIHEHKGASPDWCWATWIIIKILKKETGEEMDICPVNQHRS